MVDTADLNIMMADRDLNLIYMNQASMQTLQKLQQYLPVPADKMVGQNLDIFHKKPEYQRGILSNPANLPHQAEFQIGPEWIKLNVLAINDKDGNYIGPMVNWTVITAEKTNEEQAV